MQELEKLASLITNDDNDNIEARLKSVFSCGFRLYCEELKHLLTRCRYPLILLKKLFQIGDGKLLNILRLRKPNLHPDEFVERLLIPAIELGWFELCKLYIDQGVPCCFVARHYENDPKQPLWIACFGSSKSRTTGSDSMLKIIQLLLDQPTVTPWLHDRKGRCLLDCLWLGTYYVNPHEKFFQIGKAYMIPDNLSRVRNMLKTAMAYWTPRRHNALFPAYFRQRVTTFLLCELRLRRETGIRLPRDPRLLICQQLAIVESENRHAYMETHLQRLPKKDLNPIVDVDANMPKSRLQKMLKRDLINSAMSRYEISEHPPLKRCRCEEDTTTFGTLLCLEDGSVVASCDIRHPWIHVGRAAPQTAFHELDIDLQPLCRHGSARRVSRLHFTLRYNTDILRWQILIHGRNGLSIDWQYQGPRTSWLNLTTNEFDLLHAHVNLSFRIVEKNLLA